MDLNNGSDPILRRELDAKLARILDRIKHAEERQRDRAGAIEKALMLQAEEYERRLAALNHEAVRILAITNKVVSIDTWNAWIKEYDNWRIGVDKIAAARMGQETTLKTVWGVIVIVVSVAISLITNLFMR